MFDRKESVPQLHLTLKLSLFFEFKALFVLSFRPILNCWTTSTRKEKLQSGKLLILQESIFRVFSMSSVKGASTSGKVKTSSKRKLNDCSERFQTCYAYCKLLDFVDNPV